MPFRQVKNPAAEGAPSAAGLFLLGESKLEGWGPFWRLFYRLAGGDGFAGAFPAFPFLTGGFGFGSSGKVIGVAS